VSARAREPAVSGRVLRAVRYRHGCHVHVARTTWMWHWCRWMRRLPRGWQGRWGPWGRRR